MTTTQLIEQLKAIEVRFGHALPVCVENNENFDWPDIGNVTVVENSMLHYVVLIQPKIQI